MRRGRSLVAVFALLCCAGTEKEAARQPVGPVRFREGRAAPWRMSPVLAETTSTVECSFDVRGLGEGTRVSVLWRRAGVELARTEHVASRLARTLSSELGTEGPLGSGTYEVEVRVDDRPAATTSFRIAGAEAAPPTDGPPGRPRVVGLTLASSDCVPGPSAGRAAPVRFAQGIATIHLCLEYEDVRAGQSLEVGWYRSSSPREPLASTRYSPEGGGELSASFADSGVLRPGAYHVAVHLDGAEVARARFVIE